jgi:hypothetical protein
MKIQIKESVLGTHYWKDCNTPSVLFLKNEHHHDFWFYVSCEVTHGDREIEFLTLRIWLKKYLLENYDTIGGIMRFGPRSCEMLSKELKQALIKQFSNKKWMVIVSEDNNHLGGEW